MHYEVKQLLATGKLREAIDFVLRLQSSSVSDKPTEDLVAIGRTTLKLPNGLERENLLVATTDAHLRFGDIEHASELIIALNNSRTADKYAEIIKNILSLRQDSLVVGG